MTERFQQRGFTLIELVMVIIIAGVLATIALRQTNKTIEAARYVQTLRELDALSYAIAGNPSLYDAGTRTDYGYVGDVGAMPPNLDALLSDPGLPTWDGPYMTEGLDASDFKSDGWSVAYSYTDTLIRSTGSGSNIDKILARSTAALLSNQVSGTVRDARQALPGSVYADSLAVRLIYPSGGSMTSSTVTPSPDGYFTISGIPIGLHELQVIYLPLDDTITLTVALDPGSTSYLDVVFPSALF